MLSFDISFSTNDPEYINVIWELSDYIVRKNKGTALLPQLFRSIIYFIKRGRCRKYPLDVTYTIAEENLIINQSGMKMILDYKNLNHYVMQETFLLLNFNIFLQKNTKKTQKYFYVLIPKKYLTEEQIQNLLNIINPYLS